MKLLMLLKEMLHLVRRHKLYVLMPLLLLLILLALLAFYVGPGVVVTFIYSGV